MKKLSLVIVALVVGVFLVMPYVTGIVAEKGTSQLVNNMNHHFAAYGQTQIVDYQRSYNNTQASYKFRLNDSIPVDINYTCSGKHGVTSYQYNCKLQDMPKYQDWVANNLDGKDPITISGSVSALGQINQHIDLESFVLRSGEGDIHIGKGRLTIEGDQKLSEVKLVGLFDSMALKSEDASFGFERLGIKGEMIGNDGSLPQGNIDVSANNLTLDSKDSTLSLSDIKLDSWSKIDAEHLSSSTKLVVAEVIAPKQNLSVEDLSWQLDFSGLPAVAVNNLTQKITATSASSNSTSAQSATNSALNFSHLSSNLDQILVPGLTVSTAAQAIVGNETNSAKLSIELLEQLKPKDALVIMFDQVSLLKKLAIAINLQLSDSLIEKSFLGQDVSRNALFSHKDGLHKLSINTNGTSAELNGETMNLADFVNKLIRGSY